MNRLGLPEVNRNGSQPDSQTQSPKAVAISGWNAVHAAVLFLLLFLPHRAAGAAEPSLAIVQSGVQQSEDAPFVSSEYSFLPGEYVHFTFQVAGFTVQSGGEEKARKISLTYEVSATDSRGLALVQPDVGVIDTTLNAEDKTWIPKRRSVFLIPSFVAAGEFHIHVLVKDVLGKVEASSDFPFHIGGTKIKPAAALEIENFQFFRTENEGLPLQVPAFRAGDTIYARFDMVGFRTVGPQNEYHLSYGVSVLRPDGKTFVDDPKAAEIRDASFHPPEYLPGNVAITTIGTTTRGGYLVVLSVRDLISNQTYQTKQVFTIE